MKLLETFEIIYFNVTFSPSDDIYMWKAPEGGMRLIALKGMAVQLCLLRSYVQEAIHGR